MYAINERYFVWVDTLHPIQQFFRHIRTSYKVAKVRLLRVGFKFQGWKMTAYYLLVGVGVLGIQSFCQPAITTVPKKNNGIDLEFYFR